MKRAIILLLVLLLSLCGFAGAEDRVLEGNTYVSGLPIVEKPITLRIASGRHTLDKSESFNDKAVFQKAAAETGIAIEWIELISGTETEKVNIMLASDLPDIFFMLINEEHVSKNSGALFNLAAQEGYLQKWAPNICAQYEEIPDIWDMLRFPDGSIYSLASAMQTSYDNEAEGVTFINQKWLDD
ncbi:MAG TPA: hypothetical protein PKE04_02900, partial [Clostridia bacterium]|nr:hypothetical protein [Clostridia bacterium]